MKPEQRRSVIVGFVHGVAVVALLAVFALYTRPSFLVSLADQVWACFQ